MPNVTQIISSRVPLIDSNTGQINREWYRFFYNLYYATGGTTDGAVPINRGGTGAIDATNARTNLGLGTMATQNIGANGSFTTVDGKTVTVVNGIITSIV